MVYTLSYSNINDADIVNVGQNACFLSKLSNSNVNVCLFFAVTKKAFYDFLEHNSARRVFEKISSESGDFWGEFKLAFSDFSFPEDMKREIKEAYDAISISGSDVSNILRSFEARVNIFLSSDNSLDSSFYLNIKGFDNVLRVIKTCWFFLIKNQGVSFFKKSDSGHSFGIVVQKFVVPSFSIEAEVSSEAENIFISAYKGLPEVSGSIVKDFYVLSFNHLEFITYELNNQNFSIIHQDESGVLLKKRLGRAGSDDKASKQVISDCGRIAKKVFSVLGVFVKMIFLIKKDVPYLFFVSSYASDDSFSSKSVSETLVDDISDLGYSDVVEPPIMEDSSKEFVGLSVHKKGVEGFKEDDEVKSSGDVENVDDVDEFIVQDPLVVSDVDNSDFSLFFSFVARLEEYLVNFYKESFGFVPVDFVEAVYELDAKYNFKHRDKFLRVLEVKSLIMSGEKVDDDIISSQLGFLEDFFKEDTK